MAGILDWFNSLPESERRRIQQAEDQRNRILKIAPELEAFLPPLQGKTRAETLQDLLIGIATADPQKGLGFALGSGAAALRPDKTNMAIPQDLSGLSGLLKAIRPEPKDVPEELQKIAALRQYPPGTPEHETLRRAIAKDLIGGLSTEGELINIAENTLGIFSEEEQRLAREQLAAKTRPPTTTVNVTNIADKAEEEGSKVLARALGETITEVRKQASDAQRTLAAFQRIYDISEEAVFGKNPVMDTIDGIYSMLSNFGFDTSSFRGLDARKALESEFSRATLERAGGSLGAQISNSDLEFIKAISGSLAFAKHSVQAIALVNMSIEKAKIRYAREVENWLAKQSESGRNITGRDENGKTLYQHMQDWVEEQKNWALEPGEREKIWSLIKKGQAEEVRNPKLSLEAARERLGPPPQPANPMVGSPLGGMVP